MGLRRLTRLLTNRNATASWADVMADSYNALLGVVIFVAILWAPLQRASQAPPSTAPFQLEPVWLVIVGCVWALAFLVSAMSRIGPVALSPPQVRWWLPSMESRHRLLRPVLIVRWLIAVAGGGILGLLLSLGVSTPIGPMIAAGALLSSAFVSTLVATQPTRREARWTDAVVGVIPLLGAAVALAGISAPSVPTEAVYVILALAAISALVSGALAWRALPRIHDGDIARSAQAASELGSALMQLNTRELARAFDRPMRRVTRSSRTFGGVRGPMSAIASADAVRLARSSRHLTQIAVAIAGIIVVVSLTVYLPVIAALALAILGYVAALASAEGARRAQQTPVLDLLMPLSARMTRFARLLVPTGVMIAVGGLLLGLIGVRVGDAGMFVLLGITGAPAWAASVLRAAYREQKQLSGAVVPTPMGAFPADAFQVFATGIDLAMFALLPTFIAVLISAPTWPLILIQAALSALAAWWVIHSANKKKS